MFSLVTTVQRRAHALGHWGFNGHRTLCEPQHPIIGRLPDCHKRIGYWALLLPFALIETVVRVGLVAALFPQAQPSAGHSVSPSQFMSMYEGLGNV